MARLFGEIFPKDTKVPGNLRILLDPRVEGATLCGKKALLGRQPSCRYFPPLWRKAHSALGGAIIAPAPPAIGRYAIYIKNQDKSKPLLFNAASSGFV